MKLIAITGSIATGKSFILDIFKELGVPTFSCDEELRKIMDSDKAVVKQVKENFPEAVVKFGPIVSSRRKPGSSTLGQYDIVKGYDNLDPGFRRGDTALNRKILGDIIFSNPSRREQLEDILYPKLHVRRAEFIKKHEHASVIAVEVPLLYEKKQEDDYDVVIVTTVSKKIQQQRAAKRGITRKKLEAILSNQLPNSIKTGRADYVIDTNYEKAVLQERIRPIVSDIRSCN